LSGAKLHGYQHCAKQQSGGQPFCHQELQSKQGMPALNSAAAEHQGNAYGKKETLTTGQL
jgi:hypothetical protein